MPRLQRGMLEGARSLALQARLVCFAPLALGRAHAPRRRSGEPMFRAVGAGLRDGAFLPCSRRGLLSLRRGFPSLHTLHTFTLFTHITFCPSRCGAVSRPRHSCDRKVSNTLPQPWQTIRKMLMPHRRRPASGDQPAIRAANRGPAQASSSAAY